MATLELTSRPGSEFCIWLSASHTSFCLGSKAWWLKLLECPRHCWIWCFSASVIHKFQFAELSQKSYIFGAAFLQLPPEWTVPHPQSFLTVKCSSGSLVWDHARAITRSGLWRRGNTLLSVWLKLLLQRLTPGRSCSPAWHPMFPYGSKQWLWAISPLEAGSPEAQQHRK